MALTHPEPAARPAMMCHLLGVVEYASSLALQQRLVYEAAGRNDGGITLLVCEHPRVISIGRQGSRGDVRFDTAELASLQLEMRRVNRGGGSLLHAPGQLAVYPIVPLAWHGWTVGELLARCESALSSALGEAGFTTHRQSAARGLWGRSGKLVEIGAAVRSGISYHGAFINVDPPMHLMRRICTDRTTSQAMSSLTVERPRGVRMAAIRQQVINHFATAFETPQLHLLTGHPLLVRTKPNDQGVAARAG